MNIEKIASNLYRNVYKLQGHRNILVDEQKHFEAGNKIIKMFEDAELNVSVQYFKLPGCDYTFRNIEGSIGDVKNQPFVVLVAHYDTVETTFGANDNAAGVSMLAEIGRMLKDSGSEKAFSLVAVDLEESRSNPVIFGKELEILKSLGIKDEQNRYTSLANKKLIESLNKEASAHYSKGGDQGEGYRLALQKAKDKLSDKEYEGFTKISHLYDGIDLRSSIGKRSRIGSNEWLKMATDESRQIDYVIALDEPGIYYDEPHTQKVMPGIDFNIFTEGYALDEKNRVGNFAVILSVINSMEQGKELADTLKSEEVSMPYGWGHIPMDFDGIASNIPDGLGSDHAAFLRDGIPCLFVFDSSSPRDPFVHTYGDTINVINFEYMAKLTYGIFKMLKDRD